MLANHILGQPLWWKNKVHVASIAALPDIYSNVIDNENVCNCLLEYLSAMIYDRSSIIMLLLTDLLENSFDELVIHGKSCIYDLSSYFSGNTSKQHFTT